MVRYPVGVTSGESWCGAEGRRDEKGIIRKIPMPHAVRTDIPPARRAAVIFQMLDACAISGKSDVLRATDIT